MTKEERIQYGMEGEIAVKEYFESFGINLHHNLVTASPGSNDFFKQVYYNLNHGDLIMLRGNFDSNVEPHKQSLFKIDVKRGTLISEKSLKDYRGQFYFLIPNGDLNKIEDTRVIWRRAAVSYITKATNGFDHNHKKVINLRDEEYGYRLTNKLYRELSLKDFRERLIKRIITNPDDLNSGGTDFFKTFFVGPPKKDDL